MVDKAVPREGYPITLEGKEVGVVTTGMYAPTLKRYLGMALVSQEISKIGTELAVLVRDKPKKVKIVKRPFYIPAYRR
jgi:aminomethyltransferase